MSGTRSFPPELVERIARTLGRVQADPAGNWTRDAARAVLLEHHDTIAAAAVRETADWVGRDPAMPAEVAEALRHRAGAVEVRHSSAAQVRRAKILAASRIR